MILVKSPLRITLAGGGTDLPSYSRFYGGRVISAAIDKYVYIALSKPFSNEFFLKYSKQEVVEFIEDIQHPIIREAFKLYPFDGGKVEISVMADVPAGTGLGSSGSFTCALLGALDSYFGIKASKGDLAEKACLIELEKLNEPVGRQDQYISSFGGIQILEFNMDDSSSVTPLQLSVDVFSKLEKNIQLFYTGKSRSASSILEDQNIRTKESDSEILKRLHRIKEQSYEIQSALENGDGNQFAEILNSHWQEKRSRSSDMTNAKIDSMYDFALANGASGAKVVGAGGGGFLMTYSNNPKSLREEMSKSGIRELEFSFDRAGTRELLS